MTVIWWQHVVRRKLVVEGSMLCGQPAQVGRLKRIVREGEVGCIEGILEYLP
jgi:hypothetical protein